MSDIEINADPPLHYSQRMQIRLRTPLLITGAFAILIFVFRVLLKNDAPYLYIILAITAVFVQYMSVVQEETYYMTHLKLGKDEVEITYSKKDEPFDLVGKPGEFKFVKKTALGRTGSRYQESYLEIYYKGKMLLRQYSSEDWTDMKFIEIMHAAKNG
jgi:hypothetical protein